MDDIGAHLDARVNAVAVHPSGQGLVVLVSRFLDDEDDRQELELVEITSGRMRPRRQPLAGSDDELALTLVTAVSDRLVFVLHHFGAGRALGAFRVLDGDLVEAYRVAAPRKMRLVQDAGSRRAMALVESRHAIELVELGPEPPSLPVPESDSRREQLPLLQPPFLCGHAPEGTILARAEAASREGRWAEVRSLLETSEVLAETPALAAHAHHLLGIACLQGGDVEGARSAWERGRTADLSPIIPCEIDTCLELIAPLPEPLTARGWDREQPVARQLRGAVRVADQCLFREDFRGALDALRRPVVFRVPRAGAAGGHCRTTLGHHPKQAILKW